MRAWWVGLCWLGLACTADAAEVVLHVTSGVLESRLQAARENGRCDPTLSDTACLTHLADSVIPWMTAGQDHTLAALGITVEVRR